MAFMALCLTISKTFSVSSFKSHPCNASTHLCLAVVMLMAFAWALLFIHTTFTVVTALYLYISTSFLSSGWRLSLGYYRYAKARTMSSTSGLCLDLLSINHISVKWSRWGVLVRVLCDFGVVFGCTYILLYENKMFWNQRLASSSFGLDEDCQQSCASLAEKQADLGLNPAVA